MSSCKQMYLFEECEIDEVRREVSNVRKGIFQRHSLLMSMIQDIQKDILEIKEQNSQKPQKFSK